MSIEYKCGLAKGWKISGDEMEHLIEIHNELDTIEAFEEVLDMWRINLDSWSASNETYLFAYPLLTLDGEGVAISIDMDFSDMEDWDEEAAMINAYQRFIEPYITPRRINIFMYQQVY